MEKWSLVSLDSIVCKGECNKRILFNGEYFVVNLLVDRKRSMGKAGAFPEAEEGNRPWLEGRELTFLALARLEIGKCHCCGYKITWSCVKGEEVNYIFPLLRALLLCFYSFFFFFSELKTTNWNMFTDKCFIVLTSILPSSLNFQCKWHSNP